MSSVVLAYTLAVYVRQGGCDSRLKFWWIHASENNRWIWQALDYDWLDLIWGDMLSVLWIEICNSIASNPWSITNKIFHNYTPACGKKSTISPVM